MDHDCNLERAVCLGLEMGAELHDWGMYMFGLVGVIKPRDG